MWVEEMPYQNVNQDVVIEFHQRLIIKFIIPQTIISDNGPSFLAEKFSHFIFDYRIF